MSLKSIPLHNTSNRAKKEDKNIADNKVSRTWMTKINHAIKILMIVLSVFFIGYLLESYRDVSVLLGNYFEISTELLPLVLSFSIFVMTWHAYAKNKSSYSLFLGAAFLATGVFDLYHMISYPFMPDFITRNTPQKEALFWILARLISTILFLASVYIYKDSLIRLINKPGMFVSINVLSIILLIEVLRDSDRLPAMYYPDGSFSAAWIFVILLTSVIILYTSYLYTKRRQESGQNSTVCLIYGFIIIVCSNLVSISYDYSGNLLRAAGYYFVYLALFSSSIEQPYEKLVLAQDKLRHVAEERYRNLFDNANDAIITTDFEDRITSWNRSAEKMFGWMGQEATGKNLSLLIFPQNLMEEIENSIHSAISGNELTGFETACLCKDGTKIDVSMTISPLRDANQEIIGLSAIIRDITERKKAEEDLRESEKKYSTLVEKGSDGIVIIQDGILKFANPKIAEMTGFTRGEMLGRSFLDFISPDYREYLLNSYEKRRYGKKALNLFEVNILSKDGRDIFVEIYANDIEYERKTATMFIFHDVTERKKSDEDIKKRLMKFRLDDGTLYLVKESIPTLSLGAFNDLLKVGYKGIVISRTPEEEFESGIEGDDFEFLWLAERGGEKALPPELGEIIRRIEQRQLKRKVILIDGLDYLIFKNGFKDTRSFVHDLRELAYLSGCVIIMSVDTHTLSDGELRLLEKETKEVAPAYKGTLPDDQLGILRYIYGQNSMGVKPSYSDIGIEMKMSKPTVRKKIRHLVYTGYAIEVVKGRNKDVELTDKGRRLFLK